ncbi:MAG: exodeoxyribonuclease V subunit gamma, partial [Lautropia sp.]|nr:exodeoxyribonuclease V subunit gamma [Lautropia sp.]
MTASIAPGFIVIHGNQSETLRDLLRDWVRAHPLSPLENDIILVQSNGVAQWLTLSLAADPDADGDGGGLGIAAATELQLPSRFIWQAYRHVLGDDVVPVRAPLGKDLLTWRLMRLLPALIDGPDRDIFAPLARFLQDDPQLRRRHQLAARLADLFDQYQVYRADWLDDWAAGRDVLRTQRHGTQPLKDDVRWQAALWRVLLEDAAEVADGNRAAIHQRFMAACAEPDRARPPALARRILVFGISALPRQALDVLAALGRWCQVLMCVQNPCRHYWGDIVPERDLLSARRSRHQPRATHGGGAPQLVGLDHGHALLAAWGRQGRDLIGLLSEHDDLELSESRLHGISRRADVFVDASADTLLMQLQQDILDLSPLAETRGRWPAVDADTDVSVRFHACHSPQREVEVLHDQLLAAFAADPSLRPRDVMVMVPDIAVFAPHIEAVFGLHPADDPRHIPFSIADQARRAEEPLLRALEFLLSLPQSRVTATDVLDLLDVSAVQQRFGIDALQLPTIRQWIQASGIRWGLDRTQRAALDLGEPVDRNSWHFGLQRMLLGYAVGSGGAWADIEPLDEISGLDASLLGQLMALLDALNDTWQALNEPAEPRVWVERLRAMLGRFFSAEDEHEALILLRLEESLVQWQADCEDTGMDLPLPLSVVREHWLASIEDDGLNRRFFAGAVTFATLMPMRAIPFRLVCLLGMNDKEFPRERVPMDFDLMA